MKEFSDVYEQQYAVALFNSVRFEIEGGGGAQSQLLHRKASASHQLERGSSNLLSEQKQTMGGETSFIWTQRRPDFDIFSNPLYLLLSILFYFYRLEWCCCFCYIEEATMMLPKIWTKAQKQSNFMGVYYNICLWLQLSFNWGRTYWYPGFPFLLNLTNWGIIVLFNLPLVPLNYGHVSGILGIVL